MEIVANLLMVLLVAFLIGMPFIKKNWVYQESYADDEIEVNRKELLFSALGEIEFDYRMKKLGDEDYQELKAGYQKDALNILNQEENELEKELEEKLTKKRSNRQSQSGDDDE
ncbi:MAG: hypothetical protein C4550_07040 [Nitrospiraceae bacterium]|nr:MAG: hypothetical protein C4550_07040 [Nitrospiraceae bacterium]